MSESPVNAERNSQPLRWFQYRLWSLLLFMCLFSCACAVYFRWAAWEVVKVIKPEGDGSVLSATFSSDGSKLLVYAGGTQDPKIILSDYTAVVYDRKSRQPVQKFQSKSPYAVFPRISPDGKRLILYNHDSSPTTSTFSLWDVANGEQLVAFGKKEQGLAFSPDSRLIASGAWDPSQLRYRKVFIRNAATGALIKTFETLDPRHFIFSPDSRSLIVYMRPKRLLDIETGETRPLIKGYDALVRGLAFSPRGERLLTIGDDGTLRVWETASGKQLLKIADFQASFSASFSPDGRRLLTVETAPSGLPASTSVSPLLPFSRVRVWDAENGKEIGLYGATHQPILYASFSPNGRRVLTRFSQKSHLYDLASGDLLFVFPRNAAFAPDEELVLTHSPEDVRLWRRRRPEWWWGHFYRAEVWATLLFGVLWLRQVYRRVRPATLRARPKTPPTP